ncbi:MAG: Nif3-like dinuclear metal center hexameric protein, partial [Bacteroidales bacterium]|nr:Nif3-like dinuclear metal center hexameric protein [Bacteroidales bacterium]
VLVCLDMTEAVIDEAVAGGYNLVVSHHPLIFHPLRQVGAATWQQRCVTKAVRAGIVLYAAHTNLDNAPGGVSHQMAALLGLRHVRWLAPKPGVDAGAGVVGELPAPVSRQEFLQQLQRVFKVRSLRHTPAEGTPVRTVALCGGAGAFLLPDALRAGADCFVSGEFHYHDFFDGEGMLLACLGHYESEQYTQELLRDIIVTAFPSVPVFRSACGKNPVEVLV